MNNLKIKELTLTDWGGESQPVLLICNLNKPNGDSYFFKKGVHGQFRLYSFSLNQVSDSFEALIKDLSRDYIFVEQCCDDLVMEGTVLGSKVNLKLCALTQNYKDKTVFFELLALGVGLQRLYQIDLDLSFISDTFGYNRPVVFQKNKNSYVSLLTTEDLVVDVTAANFSPGHLNYSFKFTAQVAHKTVGGSLGLNKEIYQNSQDCINVYLDYYQLWDLYFIHEIVNSLAIHSNEEVLGFTEWKKDYLKELDKDLWSFGIVS